MFQEICSILKVRDGSFHLLGDVGKRSCMLRERDDERHHDLDRFDRTFMFRCHGDGLESLKQHTIMPLSWRQNIYTGLALASPLILRSN
jgi:hypothetical protein